MTNFTRLAVLLALVTLTLTGCYNRNQNPYGYNNGIIAPPCTGGYGNYNPQGAAPNFQQYQTPPPAGYGQAYQPNPYQQNAYQQNAYPLYGAPANVASNPPTLQTAPQNFQVAPATFDQPMPSQYDSGPPVQPYVEGPTFQPPGPAQFNSTEFNSNEFNESGFSDQQGNLQQMRINQSEPESTGSGYVMVPVNNIQPAIGSGVPVYANGSVTPVSYAPLGSAAIVLPETQAAFQNRYQNPMLAGNYEPTFSPWTTAGINVARNTTSPDHDPVWRGVR